MEAERGQIVGHYTEYSFNPCISCGRNHDILVCPDVDNITKWSIRTGREYEEKHPTPPKPQEEYNPDGSINWAWVELQSYDRKG